MIFVRVRRSQRSGAPAFSAGAHVDLTIPGGWVRQYSLCNSSERHRYLIGVWKDAHSRGESKALHEAMNVGDTLQVSLPRNRFRMCGTSQQRSMYGGRTSHRRPVWL